MRRFPKVRIDRNGMVVLSGLHYRDLNSIFTAAAIHHYDTEKKYAEGSEAHQKAVKDRAGDKYGIGEVCWENYLDNVSWTRRLRILIDAVQKSPPYDHGYDNVPVTQLNQMGRFCRFRAVRQERRSRLAFEELMAQFRKEASGEQPTA